MNKTAGILVCALLVGPAYSDEDSRWSIRPYVGLSQLGDVNGPSRGLGTVDGPVDVAVDSGFTAGVALGYDINERWAAEVAWEYRTNDSETTLADGTRFTDGNYASNLISLSGVYKLSPRGRWQPYLGLGVTVAQEIDIDLEQAGVETSLEGSGDVGYRAFAGVDWALADRWQLNGEVRYGSTTGIQLDSEDVAGQVIDDLDYDPLTLAIGFRYRF
ncbi:MAG: OmpW family outer membrane protein [Pseudomonadota bacterium]